MSRVDECPTIKTVRRNIFENMDIIHSSDSEDMFYREDNSCDVTGGNDQENDEKLSELQRQLTAMQHALAEKDAHIKNLEKEKTVRPLPEVSANQPSSSQDCNN